MQYASTAHIQMLNAFNTITKQLSSITTKFEVLKIKFFYIHFFSIDLKLQHLINLNFYFTHF